MKNSRKSQKNRETQENTWGFSKPAGRRYTVSKYIYSIDMNEQDLEDDKLPQAKS